MTSQRLRTGIDLLASLSMIGVAVFLVWRALAPQQPANPTRHEITIPSKSVPIAGRLTRGSPEAKVGFIVVSEFECPFCAKFARETLPEIDAKYIETGKVLLMFRHFPLEMHRFAQEAAEVAECAGRQGRFWPLHETLFGAAAKLTTEVIQGAVETVGLDALALKACRKTDVGGIIGADAAWAKGLNVVGTPSFLFGVRRADGTLKIVEAFSGARPLPSFTEVLDRLLGGA